MEGDNQATTIQLARITRAYEAAKGYGQCDACRAQPNMPCREANGAMGVGVRPQPMTSVHIQRKRIGEL
jgi:hypothetical protein